MVICGQQQAEGFKRVRKKPLQVSKTSHFMKAVFKVN